MVVADLVDASPGEVECAGDFGWAVPVLECVTDVVVAVLDGACPVGFGFRDSFRVVPCEFAEIIHVLSVNV